jgi:hypothetical protein
MGRVRGEGLEVGFVLDLEDWENIIRHSLGTFRISSCVINSISGAEHFRKVMSFTLSIWAFWKFPCDFS